MAASPAVHRPQTLSDLIPVLERLKRPRSPAIRARIQEGADGVHRWVDDAGAPVEALGGAAGFPTWLNAMAAATRVGPVGLAKLDDPLKFYSIEPYLDGV